MHKAVGCASSLRKSSMGMVTKLERVSRNAFNVFEMDSTLHWFVVQQERMDGEGMGWILD